MKRIIISPYSKIPKNKKFSPKNYNKWQELVDLLKTEGYYIIQIGIEGEEVLNNVDMVKFNLSFDVLKVLIKDSHTFISVDNFFQHLCWRCGKKGIVIWGVSDPKIFGHDLHINVLKDEKYLRHNQFLTWDMQEYVPESFVEPEIILDILKNF